MKKTIVLSVIFIISVSYTFAQTSQNDFSFKEPVALANLSKLTLWSTQYFIHKFQSGGKIPMILANGQPSGLYADTCNFCEASLEGTAYVTDSLGNVSIVNYAKTGNKTFVDCRKCKKYAKSKLAVESWGKTLWSKSTGFGDGVLNYKLIPYRTIAVDKSTIPYGTVIYIPNVRGQSIELPNGLKVKHDGYFFAGDTGGAIKENHIDIFTGIFNANPFPNVVKSNPHMTFEAYIIADQEIVKQLAKIQTK